MAVTRGLASTVSSRAVHKARLGLPLRARGEAGTGQDVHCLFVNDPPRGALALHQHLGLHQHLPGLCPLPSQAVLLHQQWLRLSQSSGSELCKEFRREHNFKVHFTIVSNEVLKVEIMWIYLEQLLLSC